MKQLGLVSFNHGSRIRRILIDRPTVDLRPAPTKERGPDGVSPALDGHLWAWWAGAHVAGKLPCGALEQGFDWLGEDPDWPKWVHVGALAQLAGRTFDRRISSSEMGHWLTKRNVVAMKCLVMRRNRKGRVIYSTTRTFYKIG